MASISVAISGGGHRATTWGLGALLYLADAGQNREVTSVASVSGGSIANGFVAQEVDYQQVGGDELRSRVQPLLRLMASKGLFKWGRPTNWYLYGLLVIAGALGGALLRLSWMVIRALFGTPPPAMHLLQGLGVIVGLLVLGLWGLGRRSKVVDRAMRRVLFSKQGKPTRVADLAERPVEHVFCATEMQSSNQLYFAGRFVATYRLGVGTPADLPLSTAVQCSACFPLGFRARALPASPFGFMPFDQTESYQPRRVVLQDGGIYDNMADQWAQGFTERLGRWPSSAPARPGPEPGTLLVVNASGGWVWSDLKSVGWPIGEFSLAGRLVNLLYNGTTAQRRKYMVARFDRAIETGRGLRGALVNIPQSPWRVASDIARSNSADPGRVKRAAAVLEALREGEFDEKEWADLAKRNAAVKTTLGKLGVDCVTDLLFHSYVLTMGNAHIILDMPLLPLPTRAEFRKLVAGT